MSEGRGPISAAASTAVRRTNWPLRIGSGLVAVVLFLAIAGPMLAPQDPRDHHLIIQIGEKWYVPPYPAFTPGYPLGSDTLGRDLFSWLLWSVRPTIVLVVLVAAVRMVLGTAIGVGAGWSDRMPGRLCDGLISAALSVPTLIASLIVITAVGFRVGVWAFVIGLSATGWAETAQLVRERTRTVRAQDAIEAARALGSSSAQIVVLHILPQIMPMIWMLLSFEVSHAVVTTAGLGFLGYYIGGPTFAEVDDFVYRRISEMPELGQMLATVWMVLDEPWAMVAAGSVVFLIVLAFNLVGEGLQVRLTRTLGGSRGLYVRAAGVWIPWFQDHLADPVGLLFRRRWKSMVLVGLVAMAVGAGVLMWRAHLVPVTEGGDGAVPTATLGAGTPTVASESGVSEPSMPGDGSLAVPGGHLWANDGHDPWRTRWVDFSGPVTTTLQWSFEVDGGLVGGPAIDDQGILYQAASVSAESEERVGRLYALDAEGRLRWDALLGDLPAGTPALAEDGTIHVTTRAGLTAVATDGRVLWQFHAEDGKASVGGAVVAPSGDIYFKSVSGLYALWPDGSLRWHTSITETPAVQTPSMSIDGNLVHWREHTFDAEDGVPVASGVALAPQGVPLVQAVVGADGRQYWQYDVRLLRDVPEGTMTEPDIVYNWEAYTWEGADAGVTRDGHPWLVARPASQRMGLGFFWGTSEGELSSKLGVPYANAGQVVGVDSNDIAYVCMTLYGSGPTCISFGPRESRALWRVLFPGHSAFAGAALSPGRLYLAFLDGTLLALGDSAGASPAP